MLSDADPSGQAVASNGDRQRALTDRDGHRMLALRPPRPVVETRLRTNTMMTVEMMLEPKVTWKSSQWTGSVQRSG